MTETIDITPVFNEDRIRDYADRHITRDPQTHLTAKLEVLAEISDLIEEFEDDDQHNSQQKYDVLTSLIGRRHREASHELLSWFGS
jgi:hypothetical protein